MVSKEANNKSKEAQYYLGRSYEHGDGVEKDEDNALNSIRNQLNKIIVRHYVELGFL